jgi:hypothetical protein
MLKKLLDKLKKKLKSILGKEGLSPNEYMKGK